MGNPPFFCSVFSGYDPYVEGLKSVIFHGHCRHWFGWKMYHNLDQKRAINYLIFRSKMGNVKPPIIAGRIPKYHEIRPYKS